MSIKPADFFIDLVDFFSVLLPGFFVIHILTNNLSILRSLLLESNIWVYYAIGSYILGHILFAFSGLWKKSMNKWMIIQFYSKKGWLRKLFKKMPEARGIALIEQAEKIKQECFNNESYCHDIKLYEWINILMLKDDVQFTSVTKRLEADANFFRSFTIVCFLLIYFYPKCYLVLISSILMLLFSLWRFVNRRFRAEEFAALYLIDKYKRKSSDLFTAKTNN